MTAKTLSIFGVSAALLLAAGSASADTIMSFGDTTGGIDNDNQAGPFWGVEYAIDNTGVGVYSGQLSATGGASPSGANSYTATYAVSNPDPSATLLKSLTWQASSSVFFADLTDPLYIAVMTGFTVNSSGAITSIGSLVGTSQTTITGPASNAQLTWNFSGISVTAGQSYDFVLTTKANPTQASDFTTGQLELKVGTGLLTGSTILAANSSGYSNRNNWEPVFSIDLAPVPEPSTLALAALGGVGMLLMMRRRKA